MRYTDKVAYQPNIIGNSTVPLDITPLWVTVPFAKNPIWNRMHEVFDVENFLYPTLPVDIGTVKLDLKNNIRVLRCPIKMPNMSTVFLPSELECLLPLVQHVMEMEAFVNPKFKDFYCHITFENTFVNFGETQRVPGWHVDGIQNGKREPLHQIEHSYLWSNTNATEYCIQPFFMSHLDTGRHNIFDEITKQAKEENAYKGMENQVYLIDPYVVHRSPVMHESGYRSFVRITFTEKELEDPTNTKNSTLQNILQDYPERIDTRNRFYTYNGDIPWDWYAVTPMKGNQ